MSDADPRVAQGKRVLGVVPGQPPGGDRKVPEEQDLVMVSPHLLVRHAVVALAVLLMDRSRARHPQLRKVAVAAFPIFLVVWVVLTLIGFAFRGPNWGWVWPWNEWH